MILILLGPPGAGKGTQSERLAEHLEVPRIATGDILRSAVREGTDLGKKAQRYMDAGDLVPDDVILGMIDEVLDSPDARQGVVFDGFPRTVPQAEGLDNLLAERDRSVERVLVIEVPDEAIVRRMSGRRVCPQCGAVYNVHSDPPATEGVCDRCGGELVQRSDDQEETVRNRLRVYHETTAPLIGYYEEHEARVERIDGDRPIPEVKSRLLELV